MSATTEKDQSEDAILPLRVARPLLEQLDAEVLRQRRARPGQRVTRADVMRVYLYAGLASAGQDRGCAA